MHIVLHCGKEDVAEAWILVVFVTAYGAKAASESLQYSMLKAARHRTAASGMSRAGTCPNCATSSMSKRAERA